MPKSTIDPAAAASVSEADAALGIIGRAIEAAPSVDALAPAIDGIHQFAISLLAQGVGSDRITRVISALNDAVTRRIIEIDRQLHDLSGIAWAWLAFGSEGREEQTLSTDQDNGIVFQCEAKPGAEAEEKAEAAEQAAKARLLAFAQAVNADLDRCGYPLCEGNIMAGNPEWCLTLREWKLRFAGWIYKPEPLALLNASIFFDFRVIYGKASLADELHRYLFGISQSNTA
ncbi:MAG: DUF294 nucleotidyltransferase-like domain-containing protein, partial [Burkholderiales bacterium]